MTAEPKVEVLGVEHWFHDARTKGAVQAVRSTDLTIRDREFVSIVGPSGCGKTTLLNMIAGLITPTAGTIKIDGQPVMGPPPEMGYMFAADTLLPWRTVEKNVELGRELKRGAPSRGHAHEFIKMVGLTGFERAYPDQLSQGMRQRVALARTLSRDPQLLLMDEPFGALDAQTRILMQNEFLRLWETHQSTVIFVTHDLAEAISLADRVLVFSAHPGRIKSEYVINLPRPRDVGGVHVDPEFLRIHQKVWADLSVEVEETDHAAHKLQQAPQRRRPWASRLGKGAIRG